MNQDIKELYNIFTANNFELYLVGGCVRDYILKKPIKDIDLVTNATPEQISKILQAYSLDLTGKKFAVIRVFFTISKQSYEIATYRKDISKGRNPIVDYNNISISEDALRRDLTINSLYMHPINNQILDFTTGLKDIKNLIINTPGKAHDRFKEDPLRILRAIRFKNRYNARYSTQVIKELHHISNFELILPDGTKEKLSQERIIEEFIKGIKESVDIKTYLDELHQFNFLKYILLYSDYSIKNINTYNIETIISSYLFNMTFSTIESHLIHKVRLPKNLAKKVKILIELKDLKIENAIELKYKINASNLNTSTIVSFYKDSELHEKIAKFELNISGNTLLSEGFSGKKLKTELIKRETKNLIQYRIDK